MEGVNSWHGIAMQDRYILEIFIKRYELINENNTTFLLDARDRLRKWREDNDRKSEEVVDLFISYIGSNLSKLGDESKRMQ